MKKIFIINIVLLLFVYFICDFLCFKKNLLVEARKNSPCVNQKSYFYNAFYWPIENFKNSVFNAENATPDNKRIVFRIDNPIETNKKSVILYGCSYTFGVGLDKESTFSAKLQNLSSRTVYNRALAGYGIQHSLYLVENMLSTLLSKAKKPPDTVIYTFIEDHLHRLYRPNDFFDRYLMFYKYDKNGVLVPCTSFDFLFWNSFILRNYYFSTYDKSLYRDVQGNALLEFTAKKFLLDSFLQINSGLRKKIKNVRFVIFVYNGDSVIKSIEKSLIENKIEIVYLSELSSENFNDDKYKLLNDFHPNEKAWDVITPLIVRKLNL